MARSQPSADRTELGTTFVASQGADPIEDLPRARDLTLACPNGDGHEIVSQPAIDLAPGRKLKCKDCGREGRIKTNHYGRVTMLRRFEIEDEWE